MVNILDKKFLCDFEYHGNGKFAAGLITTDEYKAIKILNGVICDENNGMKKLGMFTWNIENNSFDMIKTENQELISNIISDILVEIKKEGL